MKLWVFFYVNTGSPSFFFKDCPNMLQYFGTDRPRQSSLFMVRHFCPFQETEAEYITHNIHATFDSHGNVHNVKYSTGTGLT
jgi:hypothetical protein